MGEMINDEEVEELIQGFSEEYGPPRLAGEPLGPLPGEAKTGEGGHGR